MFNHSTYCSLNEIILWLSSSKIFVLFFPKQLLMPGFCGLSLFLSTFVNRCACASQGMPGGVVVLLHKGVTSLMARGSASVLGTGKHHGEFSN